jgi:bacteriorhodopsin
MSTFTVDDPAMAFLAQRDLTAVTFWIISIAMIACTVFLFAVASTVNSHWKTSIHVGGLVTLVAAVHYMYMREYWVAVHASPVVYRYIDWTITVPLQMIEFNLIIKAAGASIGPGGFWRLLLGTVAMLVFGYIGETSRRNIAVCGAGFALGLCGWFFILFEIFAGESAKACPQDEHVKSAFGLMKKIVSVGWSIYPLGYFFGTLTTAASAELLNVIYNIADFVNKIAFVLACWSCAKSASEKNSPLLA